MNGCFFFDEQHKLCCTGTAPFRRDFAHSPAEGLLSILQQEIPENPPADLLFLRHITSDYLQECMRNDQFRQIPGEPWLNTLCEKAPSFANGVTCTPDDLRELFTGLSVYLEAHAPEREYLQVRFPAWKDIGRITFHLAENRQDTDGRHPFVFLATYPDHTDEQGEIRHIPLVTALKQYAADKETLNRLLSSVRTAAEKSPFLAAMLENKSVFRPCVWSPQDAFLFVRDIELFRSAGIQVRLNKNDGKRPPRLRLDIAFDAPPPRKGEPVTANLLRFSVRAALGDQIITEEELAEILKTGGGLIRVRGEWVEADTEQVSKLLTQWRRAERLAQVAGIPFLHGLRMISGMRLPANAPELPPADDELCNIHASETLKQLLEQGIPDDIMPPFPAHIPLRHYQQQGVRWLYRMGSLGLGGCLADDMGLGKTIQVLTYLEILRQQNIFAGHGAALAVVPASLLENWRNEAGKFTPELRVAVLHASAGTLEDFRNDPEGFFAAHDLVITSYSMALRLEPLQTLHFPVLLLDEAQNIKNPACRQSGVLRKFTADRKFALTGTPLENSITDLWSIFDFLIPQFLGTYAHFRESVKAMEHDTEKGFAPLRKMVQPCILRRLKTDRSIIPDLPDKSEMTVRCHLTTVQAKMYQRAVEQFRNELYSAEEERRRGVILSYLMQFKQICNHPAQFSGLGNYDVERSGKFQYLKALAADIASRGDKVLVFTQFREMIQPIHNLLAEQFNQNGLMLHGSMSIPERQAAVENFQSPAGAPFFVLSLRAAGVGLNLTAANHVIHFDRWWNPAVENQATDRAYRIGQHRNVLVHKFVCRGTLEERIDAMIREKVRLSEKLLHNDGGEKLLTEMSNDELMAFVQCDTASLL
ncbi:MAG: DEAD/DEAH box helicase [Lentisphaeria bacterium]|nr:DEAD/DEAH box helicase [Lentisphaeria bacterium]